MNNDLSKDELANQLKILRYKASKYDAIKQAIDNLDERYERDQHANASTYAFAIVDIIKNLL